MRSNSLGRAFLIGSLGALCTAASCRDPVARSDTHVTGSYTLVGINGSALPATLATGNRVTGGSLELRPDHSFVQPITACIGWPDRCTHGFTINEGTWSLAAGQLTLTSGTFTLTGEADGQVVKLHLLSDLLEFER